MCSGYICKIMYILYVVFCMLVCCSSLLSLHLLRIKDETVSTT